MSHHQSLKLSQAAQAVIDARLASALNAAAPSNVPKCHDLAGNVTPHTQIRKTNPIPLASRRKSLSPGQLAAISMLLTGHSVAAVARRMAISKRTLFRWKLQPEFDAEIRRRAEALGSRLTSTSSVESRLSEPTRKQKEETDADEAEFQREFDEIMAIGRNVFAGKSAHR